jgi:hypothetical protein
MRVAKVVGFNPTTFGVFVGRDDRVDQFCGEYVVATSLAPLVRLLDLSAFDAELPLRGTQSRDPSHWRTAAVRSF